MLTLTTLAQQIRQIAFAEILPRWRQTPVEIKTDGSFITAADLAVQNRLMAVLRDHDPYIPILSEELPAAEQSSLLAAAINGKRFWCLDPVDGTSNYACGFPYFAVSLALFTAGRAQLAIVFDPVHDECFTAERGQGAWCNGQPITPFAPSPLLTNALAMIDLKRLPAARLAPLLTNNTFRSQRNLGSVALDWCWLAAGRYQLYLHGGQRLWDYAAGRLIATEAGVTSALYARDGTQSFNDLDLMPRIAIAAANTNLFEQWQSFVNLPLETA
ncbi:inositol monophosphatase family protein [Thiospirillum jenense]|uniref:Inositol monophosphatase family protein n=1 Tax=Thiospirillum jenense TaxID=1653858 RepID=A0A839HHF1_9GAMM|nr:inositol monophosphatase family protein [Thiospirillum jenense]MBB1126427.1 inositol monophosphatase family protein [Thiospirillum jenense]